MGGVGPNAPLLFSGSGLQFAGRRLAYRPSPVDLSHLRSKRVVSAPFPGALQASFPFSYDLRTKGKLTAVRDQAECGSCWTFGTYSSLESILLPDASWDFSENHMKNTHGFDAGHCDGGQFLMATAYLTRLGGPVAESDDPYDPASDGSPASPTLRRRVHEVLYLPGRAGPADNDNIKQALMTHGAVATVVYMVKAAYNSTTAAYYHDTNTLPNHAVTIVGWDDGYSASNFATPPPGDGAFIIRNSWGSTWGDSGYFYVSYHDAVLGLENVVFTVDADPIADPLRVYQYDPLGLVSSVGYSRDTAWMANVFTAQANELPAAVAFYTLGLDTTYTVSIYDGVSTSPRGDMLLGSASGTLAHAGYHTVPLNTAGATLTKGQPFSVVVELSTPGASFPVAIERPLANYSSQATASAGQSYVSPDGATWTDLTSTFPDANVCLKVFTRPDCDDANPCTVDTWNGVSCTYAPAPTGTLCRAATGPCDVAETCSGSSGACPDDAVKSNGAVCREATNRCDLAETCDGMTKVCPVDLLEATGTPCPGGSCAGLSCVPFASPDAGPAPDTALACDAGASSDIAPTVDTTPSVDTSVGSDAAPDATTSPDSGTSKTSTTELGGCACQLGDSQGEQAAPLMLALVLFALVRRRRRRVIPARSSSACLPMGLVLLAALGLLASCDSSETPSGPLEIGGDRTQIVVVSDIHLGADLAYAEFNKNRQPLVDFLSKVRASSTVKELVIAGDLIDEWFVPATSQTYAVGGQADFVGRVAAANRDVIDAFAQIIREGNVRVTYVPGNHDLTITAENVSSILPGIHQARDDVQGLGTYSPQGHPEIAIEHGHRYNFFCAPDPLSNSSVAPGSILPPGYFFTRIAALSVAQQCKTPKESIPTVTPNTGGGASQTLAYAYWNIWKTLMLQLPVDNMFDDKIITTQVGGFTQTYAISDLMPYQATPGGLIEMNLFQGAMDNWEQRQTLNHVPVHLPTLQAITGSSSAAETDAQATLQYFSNAASDVRIVVFGHTHETQLIAAENHAGLKSLYANSGTWIDHNPNGSTMNVVVINPQGPDAQAQTEVKVYDVVKGVMTETATDSLRL